MNVVVEDVAGRPAQIEHAAEWRDQFALPFEVLADAEETWIREWGDSGSQTFGQHSYTVVNSDGTVAWHTFGYDGETVDTIIEEAEAAF